MKIAIAGVITKKIEPHSQGGTEMFTYLLVDGLVKLGHEVTLYCAKGSNTAAQDQIEVCSAEDAMANESNIEFVYPYTLLQIRKIVEDLQSKQFDILHVNSLKTFLFSFFAKDIKLPIIQTIHRDFMEHERIFQVYKKIGFHKNEDFVFVSNNAKKLSLLKERVHVIHNGIITSDYPFSAADNQVDFLWLSRIDELKGPLEAILAAKEAGVPLILSGEADREKYRVYFQDVIKPLLTSSITHESFSMKKRKIELYQNAKAFLFPIQWEEPFGLVVVEAMSCGTPIIAFNRGAMSEIVVDGITGYLVDPSKGVKGLVDAIRKLTSLSPEQYFDMRRKNRERVEKLFTVEKMVESYEALYRQVLNNNL